MDGSSRAMARLGGAVPAPRSGPAPGSGYPWVDGELLYAADLNAAIAYSASVYDMSSFGAKTDGVTDDSAALLAAIAAVLALPTGGKVIIPAGRTLLASWISVNVPAGKALTLEGAGAAASELHFSGSSGLDFQLLYSGAAWGGLHLRDFSLIRGPTSPASADTGLNIWVSPTINQLYGGIIDLRDLIIKGSSPGVNQWKYSLVLSGVSSCSLDNIQITGINSTAVDQGDVLLTFQGFNANQYAVTLMITNSILIGASVGLLVGSWVQGVLVSNSSIVGSYDNIRWLGGTGLAEQLAVTNCSLAAGHRGVLISQVNQSNVSGTVVLHFNTGVADWAGIEFDVGGLNTASCNNIVGAMGGAENGIVIKDSSGPNTIVGNTIYSILDTGIYLQGGTTNTTVVGNNITSGNFAIIQSTAINTILGNTWNGVPLDFAQTGSDRSGMVLNGPGGTTTLTFAVPGGTNTFAFVIGGHPRWIVGTDGSPASGANQGDNFEFVSIDDTGALLGAPFVINRMTGLVSFNSYGGSELHTVLNAANGAAHIEYNTGGESRWYVGTDGATESGGNAGSNYEIVRVSDSNAIIGQALSINRATGVVNFAQHPTVAGVPLLRYRESYANDAEAAKAGIEIGEPYRHNSNALTVRAA